MFGPSGLLLPPPKHGESAKVEQQEAEQQPVLLLSKLSGLISMIQMQIVQNIN